MSEIQTPENVFENFEQANKYVESARMHYRRDDAPYRGTRNSDELQLIIELTDAEARAVADGTLLGMLAMNGLSPEDESPIDNDQDKEPVMGGKSWEDFRGAYAHLMTGFGVLTHRLHKRGFDIPSYADLREPDRLKVASVLFGDFLSHNALRFGVDTAGVITADTPRRVYPEDGGAPHLVYSKRDKDKARNDAELERNMRERGYETPASISPAGKFSPAEYIKLRREYPEIDKDKFDKDASYFTDLRKEYENRE